MSNKLSKLLFLRASTSGVVPGVIPTAEKDAVPSTSDEATAEAVSEEAAAEAASSSGDDSYDTDEEVARYNSKDATDISDVQVTNALAAYVQSRFSPKLIKVRIIVLWWLIKGYSSAMVAY